MKLLSLSFSALFVASIATFGIASTASAQCTNSCATSNDGECDDGGPGSLYDICELGSDCADCGARACSNTCATSNDGECDDGGPGSLYDICEYGTDCNDCGIR